MVDGADPPKVALAWKGFLKTIAPCLARRMPCVKKWNPYKSAVVKRRTPQSCQFPFEERAVAAIIVDHVPILLMEFVSLGDDSYVRRTACRKTLAHTVTDVKMGLL